MDSMKKQAIIVMLQRAKSSIPEMEPMILKRDLRPEASKRWLNTQLATTHHPKLDRKLKACFQDTTCRDLMKPCQRKLFRNHRLEEGHKFLELNQLHKAKNQTRTRKWKSTKLSKNLMKMTSKELAKLLIIPVLNLKNNYPKVVMKVNTKMKSVISQ